MVSASLKKNVYGLCMNAIHQIQPCIVYHFI